MNVAIDTETGTATITFDPQKTNAEKIMGALERAHFEVYRKPKMPWKSPREKD